MSRFEATSKIGLIFRLLLSEGDAVAVPGMSQRSSLYNAGHLAHAPACHFSEQLLVQQIGNLEDVRARTALSKLAEADKAMAETNQQLQLAAQIAKQFDLDPSPLPVTAEDYFSWLPRYVELFEQNFPMSRIDHYYFLFARKCTELLCNLRFACTCLELDMSLDDLLQLRRKADKCLKDNEYILFKLIAPAALLSSEPRQNFFNVFYRKMNSAYEPFRGAEIAAEQAGRQQLCSGLTAFGEEVRSGIKSCLTQLQELGV